MEKHWTLDIVQKIYKDKLITKIDHIDPYTCNLTVDGKIEEYSISAILMYYSKIFGKAFDEVYPQAND